MTNNNAQGNINNNNKALIFMFKEKVNRFLWSNSFKGSVALVKDR